MGLRIVAMVSLLVGCTAEPLELTLFFFGRRDHFEF